VLLVEDNEVNRRVALAVLRKLGLEAHAAVDGEQAVAFTAETRYDLVLMDMHMPNMDGLEATRAIRAREAGTAERLPIVAMTANVLGEARAACFEAGMDDFLPKPFAREHLLQALRRWVPVDSAAVAPVRSPAAEPVALALRRESLSAVMDHARLDALREALGAELAELVTVFLDSAAGTIAALVQAAEQGEPDAVYRHAHTLKSSAANIGAMALSALARRIENEHKTDPAAADACIAELAGELSRVQPLLLQAAAAAQEGLRAVG
jgi:CheY-like chemotaxis protein/HPt (histidine-containing phosphotransfer) domain-containing protein